MRLYCLGTWKGKAFAVLILYSKPVLAVGGDDFTNNLLSDLAPLIALFGEQVATQYLSQSMHWLEHVIFACAPLGMITAITCAIRVAGDKTLRAIIGRAREPKAQAEIEVMSSTSSDVCELWNGVGIVRLPGSPDVIELLYDRNSAGQAEPINDSFMGVYRRREILKPSTCRKDSPWFFRRLFKGLCSTGIIRDVQQPAVPLNLQGVETEAPNISLNTSNPAVPERELWVVAFIGVILQAGVLVFDGMVTYRWRWGKNGFLVAAYAFWLTSIGTLAVCGGMFICASVIEFSTQERMWEPESVDGKELQILWLQKGQTVSDQRFKSYAIYAAKDQRTITTSRPLNADGKYHFLTAIGTIFSVVGFVLQFIGLRGMNYWATLAQLLAMGIMTLLRVLLRRNLTSDPKRFRENETPDEDFILILSFPYNILPTFILYLIIHNCLRSTEESYYVQELPEAHELDSIANKITTCKSWGLITKDYPQPRHQGGSREISRVLRARIRLGQIAGPAWLGELHKTVLVLTETVEAVMNHLWNHSRDGIELDLRRLTDFPWVLTARTRSERGGTNGFVKLMMQRNPTVDGDDLGPWKADWAEIEAIMSLWMFHLRKQKKATDEGNNLWIIGSAGYGGDDVGRVLSDWWISREIDRVDVQDIKEACQNHKVHESRVLYCMNTKSINETLQGIVNTTSLTRMCAQFILSKFMFQAVKPTTPIVCKTSFKPIPGKRLLRVSNKKVSDLAEIIEKSGLATLDDAYRIVVPALFEADKLPNLVDKAPEILQISRKFESKDRAKDAKELCKRIRSMCIHRANALIAKKNFDQAREVCMRLVREFVEQLGTEHPETHNIRLTMKEFGVELGKDLIQSPQNPPADAQTPPFRLHRAVHAHQALEVYEILREIDIQEIDRPFPEQLANPLTEPLTQIIKGKTPLALAVENGDKTLVKLLLSFGASATAVADNTTKRTALHLIANAPQNESESERGRIVKLLLLNGADIDDQQNSTREAPLHLLAAVGDNAMVKLLVDKRASLDIKDGSGRTPLHRAAETAHQSVVEFLVEKGSDIDVRDKHGTTATHRAAGSGHDSVVRYLVGKGSNLAIKDKDGETAIHAATGNGHQATVKLLLEEDADPDVKGKDGRTSMHKAVELGQVAILKLLLERGFDPDKKDNEGSTALHIAARKGNEAAVVLLTENSADLDIKDKSGKRATHRAAEMGHQTTLEILIGKGCDPEAKDIDGKTVLHAAAGSGHESTSEFLTNSGVNPDLKDKFGRTAMHFAAESGHETVVKLFLNKGSDPDVKDHEGKTALHIAASQGHKGTVKLLLQKGASFDAKDILGRTAMHRAAGMNRGDCMKLLIGQDVDMNTRDINAETAMHLAAGKGYHDVVKFLIDGGADPNTKNKFGSTPLHKAAEGGYRDTVKLLFYSGVDLGAWDNGGRTAMKITQDNGYLAVQKLLGTRRKDFL